MEGGVMSNRCERCGGPPPVEGETYRHFWPCGCAVTFAESQAATARFDCGAADPAGDKADCMRLGGMLPAQRPPCSDCGGRWSGVIWRYSSVERRGFCRCNHRWSVAWDGSVTLVRAASEANR